MITIELKQKLPQRVSDGDFPIDPLNELDTIEYGLQSFIRHNNHIVEITQHEKKIEIELDYDLISAIEWYPTLYYISLRSSQQYFDLSPERMITLKVKREEELFVCSIIPFNYEDKLNKMEYRFLLLGFAEKIANMAKDAGYLTAEQVEDFISGKWKKLNDEAFEKYCNR